MTDVESYSMISKWIMCCCLDSVTCFILIGCMVTPGAGFTWSSVEAKAKDTSLRFRLLQYQTIWWALIVGNYFCEKGGENWISVANIYIEADTYLSGHR